MDHKKMVNAMKTITSFGGPLIGMSRASARHWSGIEGKRFIGEAASFSSDYEAACDLISGRGKPPCDIAKLVGEFSEALLLAPPIETALILKDQKSICLAQIEAAEPEWSFFNLNEADFDRANFNSGPKIHFNTVNCQFLLFDSARTWGWVKDEYLEWRMWQGDYIFSRATYDPDPLTSLILYKISRVD